MFYLGARSLLNFFPKSYANIHCNKNVLISVRFLKLFSFRLSKASILLKGNRASCTMLWKEHSWKFMKYI